MSTPTEMTLVEPDATTYGAGRLALGVLARIWLSFLGGVLLVTLLPLLLGWRPYVVESASMTPAIRAGDVVLSAPNHDPDVLLGRVIVFEAPDRPGTTVTHRVVGINDDGTLVTKGDANQSADSVSLPPDRVHGLGRLLVRGAGLPLLWVDEGAWLQLMLLATSIAIAISCVVRDDEDELVPEPVDADVVPPLRRIPMGVLPRRPRSDVPVPDARPAETEPAALPRGRRRVRAATGSTAAEADHARRGQRDDDQRDERDERDERDDDQHDDQHDGGAPAPTGVLRRSSARAPAGGGHPTPSPRALVGAVVAGLVALGAPTTAAAAFTASTDNSANAWSVPNLDYATEVLTRSPYLYWRLDDTAGNFADDSSGNGNDGRYVPNVGGGSFTRLADGALLTDTPNRAMQINSPNACIATRSNTGITGPQVYTIVAWFRAPASYTDGGKLIGFERPRTGVDAPSAGSYDRQLHLDGNGRLWFTAYNGGHVALSSSNALNDGGWHMAVGTQGANGMVLYVDGVQVESNANTAAENTTGWWRAGCGNLSGWGGQWTGPNNPGTNANVTENRPFLGSLDEITVYSGTALTATDVATLWFAR